MSSRLLLSNIGQLVTNTGPAGQADESLGLLRSHALLIEGDTIVWVGPQDDPAVESARAAGIAEVSIEGQVVMPGFVDSHTHLIHAGDRSDEFRRRMSGEPYAPAGIWDTVRATRNATDEQLVSDLSHRVRQAELTGTTTIEIKTGHNGYTFKYVLRVVYSVYYYYDGVFDATQTYYSTGRVGATITSYVGKAGTYRLDRVEGLPLVLSEKSTRRARSSSKRFRRTSRTSHASRGPGERKSA